MIFPRLLRLGRAAVLAALPCMVNAQAPGAAATSPAPELDPSRLLQLALVRNADVSYSRLQSRIADEGFQAETGLYRPSLYANARIEGRHLQRTIEQQLAALFGQVTTLDERVRAAETGVRMRAPTGAELSLGLRASQKINNVIGAAPLARSDRESTAALVLTIRQPLWRGAGRDVVETDLRVADAERQIAAWQYRQQLHRIGAEALTAFWQLQRAYAAQAIRSQSLANARDLLADVQARVDGGRLAPGAQAEAQATVANREADLARGVQAVAEGEARLRTLLDLPPEDKGWRLVVPAQDAVASAVPEVPLDAALQGWPAWRVAQLRRDQAQLRLRFANDRRKPGVDLQMSYSTNGLAYGPTESTRDALRGGHPDWYVGVAVDMPFGHDPRAEAQYRAQALKIEQAELEGSSVRQALSNDLHSRSAQFAAAQQELAQAGAEVQAREDTLEAERQQFAVGIAPLNRLLRREMEALEARLRHADAQARLALARVALQMAQGTLLSTHDVRLED